MTTAAIAEELFTPEQVAEELGFHPRTITNFTREGKMPHVRLGRKIRFRREDIEAFIAAGAKPLTPPQAKPARNPKYTK